MKPRINLLGRQPTGFLDGLLTTFFRLSSVLFGAMLIAELVEPGVVSNWFAPLWFLLIALVSGILLVLHSKS